jgi:hypothetical protein
VPRRRPRAKTIRPAERYLAAGAAEARRLGCAFVGAWAACKIPCRCPDVFAFWKQPAPTSLGLQALAEIRRAELDARPFGVCGEMAVAQPAVAAPPAPVLAG